MELEFSRHVQKYPNIKFHQNLSSGSRVPCGQKDRQTDERTSRKKWSRVKKITCYWVIIKRFICLNGLVTLRNNVTDNITKVYNHHYHYHHHYLSSSVCAIQKHRLPSQRFFCRTDSPRSLSPVRYVNVQFRTLPLLAISTNTCPNHITVHVSVPCLAHSQITSKISAVTLKQCFFFL
jgi:hypothetical protein